MQFRSSAGRTFLGVVLLGVFWFGQPILARAGCGCDKPVPAPATVIPQVAFPGMSIVLFHPSFQLGQVWQVTFQSEVLQRKLAATVVSKRTLTDPTGATFASQLIVPVPEMTMGPARITVMRDNVVFSVPETSFTVIGKPVAIAEQSGSFSIRNYTTGVGADGTVYLSVRGLNDVCQPMRFRVLLKDYPLRFGMGDIAITNHQGFFIDALDVESADHFAILPSTGSASNTLDYFRHSFASYCSEHQPGGRKEVDAQDQNWHLDGTAHTDYAVLIFAVAGHFDRNVIPRPGQVSFGLHLQAHVASSNEKWAQERGEEGSFGRLPAPGKE